MENPTPLTPFPPKSTHRPATGLPANRFQFLSDLHLELGHGQYSTFKVPVTAPYLILAGDIGKLSDAGSYLFFLETLAPKYDKIFLVLGNHEFYGMTYQEGIRAAESICAEPVLSGKVVLLHRRSYTIPQASITLLGCSLWSRIPAECEAAVVSKVKDYKQITHWTPECHNTAHSDDLSWLRSQLAAVRAGYQNTVVVVTHHAPLTKGTSRPEQELNPWTCAFATDIIGEQILEGVHTWIFGHTHYTTDFVERGIRVVSNQRGYVLPGDRNEKSGFDVGKYIEINAD